MYKQSWPSDSKRLISNANQKRRLHLRKTAPEKGTSWEKLVGIKRGALHSRTIVNTKALVVCGSQSPVVQSGLSACWPPYYLVSIDSYSCYCCGPHPVGPGDWAHSACVHSPAQFGPLIQDAQFLLYGFRYLCVPSWKHSKVHSPPQKKNTTKKTEQYKNVSDQLPSSNQSINQSTFSNWWSINLGILQSESITHLWW